MLPVVERNELMSEEENNYDEEEVVITLTLENGEEIECTVLAMFDCEGQNYVALLFPEEDENKDLEISLYRCNIGDDNVDIQDIETDEEFEKANEAFDALMSEAE